MSKYDLFYYGNLFYYENLSPVSSKSSELRRFFDCQGGAKSPFNKILKSDMGSKMTPSLISEGGPLRTPPPWEVGLRGETPKKMLNSVFTKSYPITIS